MREKRIEKVTDAAREDIRRGSVTTLPVNPSERGMSAAELQRRFVEPVVGEVSVIRELNRVVSQTEAALDELDESAGAERTRVDGEISRLTGRIDPLEGTRAEAVEAVRLSNETLKAAESAIRTANAAASAAGEISGKADTAVTVAEEAKTVAGEAKAVAQGIDGKATEALALSRTAADTADSAKTAADGIDGKVSQKVAELVASAPETLDTLAELASALGNDPDFATTVANHIGTLRSDTEAETQRLDEVKLNVGQRVTPADAVSFGEADFKRLGPGKYLTGPYEIAGLKSFANSAFEVAGEGGDYYVTAKNREGEVAETAIAQNGAAQPWKRFNYTYELDANQDDYVRFVIPLLDLTNDVIDIQRYVKGTLYLIRDNGGRRPATLSLFAQKAYNAESANGNYLNFGGVGGAMEAGDSELVTFTYSGRKYLGANVMTTAARYMSAYFDGVITGYEFSDVLGRGVAYYNSQTGAVINSEIHGSLVTWAPPQVVTSHMLAARDFVGVGDPAKINNDDGKATRFLAAYDPENVRRYLNFGQAPEPGRCAELSFNSNADSHGSNLRLGFYANDKAAKLCADGAFMVPADAYKPSGGSWLSSCDSRVKTEITDADTQLCYDNVKRLPLKYYGYDRTIFGTDEVADTHQLGWIAQDVEEVFPKAVRTADMEYVVKDEAGNPVVEAPAAYETYVDEVTGERKQRKVRDTTYKTGTVPAMKHLSYDLIYASAYGAVQKLIEKVETLETTVGVMTGDREFADKLVLKRHTGADGATYYTNMDIDAITVSAGTHVFTNCTGTVTVSGNAATVYANNCPTMTLNGKTATNWMNIWVDGWAANENPSKYFTRHASGIQILSETVAFGNAASFEYTYPLAFINSYPDISATAILTETATTISVNAVSTTKCTFVAGGNIGYATIILKGAWK